MSKVWTDTRKANKHKAERWYEKVANMETVQTQKAQQAFSTKKKKTGSRLGTGALHLMLLPAVILLIIYAYLPMVGLVIAFQDFDIGKGVSAFWRSEFVGLAHFKRVFTNPDAGRAFYNTVYIAFWKIVTMFFVPVTVALLLNEIRKSFVKRSIQTLVYLPHFLSWVILAGILKDILSPDGLVNSVLSQTFGMEPYFWLGDKNLFPHLIVWTNVWKEFGFSTIVFLAAITGIDPSLYEAAWVDGAARWKQTWHVTLPGMKPIIVLCLVLSLGGILNAGFDQIFNLYSVPVLETGDILDTLVYRLSFSSGQYDVGTAIGLFKSVVSLIFVSLSYWLAYRYANYEIF
jgi:putative aldouronate transport system permease protein